MSIFTKKSDEKELEDYEIKLKKLLDKVATIKEVPEEIEEIYFSPVMKINNYTKEQRESLYNGFFIEKDIVLRKAKNDEIMDLEELCLFYLLLNHYMLKPEGRGRSFKECLDDAEKVFEEEYGTEALRINLEKYGIEKE